MWKRRAMTNLKMVSMSLSDNTSMGGFAAIHTHTQTDTHTERELEREKETKSRTRTKNENNWEGTYELFLYKESEPLRSPRVSFKSISDPTSHTTLHRRAEGYLVQR